MLPAQPQIPQEEYCPVPEHVLGQLYRSSPQGLNELVAVIPAATRAMLALYCYRRAHLQTIGLAIATTCEKHDLETFGGNNGTALFEKSRKSPEKDSTSDYLERRKITLSKGKLRELSPIEDDESA